MAGLYSKAGQGMFDIVGKAFDPSISDEDREEYQENEAAAGKPSDAMATYRANIDAELEAPIKYRSNPDDPNSEVFENKAKTYILLEADFDPAVKDATYASIYGTKSDATPEIAARGREIHQSLVDNWREMSPGGSNADNSGISPEEMQQYRDEYGSGSAGYYYPARLQGNFDSMRRAELFSALLPEAKGNSTANALAAGAGAGLGFLKGGMERFTGRNPSANENLELARMRYGGTDGRAEEANYWYDRSRPQEGDVRYFRDPNTGDSNYQTLSSTTTGGIWGALGEDNSQTYPYAASGTLGYSQHPTMAPHLRNFLRDTQQQYKRPVPVRPDNVTPEQMSERKQFVDEYNTAQDGYIPAKIGQIAGFLPSEYSSNALNMGRYLAEPMTAVDLLQVYAGKGARALFQQVAEEIGEDQTFSTTLEAAGLDPNDEQEVGELLYKYIVMSQPASENKFLGEDSPEPVMFDKQSGKNFSEHVSKREKFWQDRLEKAASEAGYYPKPVRKMPDQSVYYQ
jgi:hypothetical protein